ncbi:MAG: SUMF1/EgtB/PvdO family nonheme iron enzyme [Bacteroidota bacterium]
MSTELLRYSWISILGMAMLACQMGDSTEMPAGMVLLPATQENESPLLVDETEVTVAQFAEFVAQTAYQTEAEDYGWSGVFNPDSMAWLPVDAAYWLFPFGPSGEQAQDHQPVVHISYRDAKTYAQWAGKRLPTEAEWLRAATANGKNRIFPWGDTELMNGKYPGNWWQGPFPQHDQVLDGFVGIAPVKSFPPTAIGLYEIGGNVWEWTSTRINGQFVMRGGSFLCSNSYCSGFRLDQRQLTDADSGLNHLGFRCVKDI